MLQYVHCLELPRPRLCTLVCIGAPVQRHPVLKLEHRAGRPTSAFIDSRTSLFLYGPLRLLISISVSIALLLAAFDFFFLLVHHKAYVSVRRADLIPPGN